MADNLRRGGPHRTTALEYGLIAVLIIIVIIVVATTLHDSLNNLFSPKETPTVSASAPATK